MNSQPTINIGLLGHVAHGKSTITKSMSGVSTAHFRAEKEKGMTIRLGYANVKIWKCDSKLCPKPWCYQPTGSDCQKVLCRRPGCGNPMTLIRHFSFIDSPGHHELMSTMLSGASVMDGMVLVVAANDVCPCPQTAEHLIAAEFLGLSSKSVVVQNKVDLCPLDRCAKNYAEIKSFLEGTNAEKAPVIPVAAIKGLNIDVLCQKLVECIPIPVRDLKSPSRMFVLRSFDINKPGTSIDHLHGGVIGGSLLKGTLKVGDEIEIRPGIIRTDGSFVPLQTRVTSLRSENVSLREAVPGGLIAIGLTIDPNLCKSDRLVGQVAGAVGTLPPVFRQAVIRYQLLKLSSSETAKIAKPKAPSEGDNILICVGADKVVARVTAVNRRSKWIDVSFSKTSLVCADTGSKVAIFLRDSQQHLKLVGNGVIQSITAMSPSFPSEIKIRSRVTIHDSDPKKEHAHVIGESRKKLEPQKLSVPIDSKDTDEIDRSKCRMYPVSSPQVGDFVIAKISRVVPGIGAYCTLLEYDDKEALISEKEISRRRIKCLRRIARVGSIEVTVVLRVDPEKGFVDLSKKRVEDDEKTDHLLWYSKSKKVDSILRRVSAFSQVPLKELYKNLMWPLYRKSQKNIDIHPLNTLQLASQGEESVLAEMLTKFDDKIRAVIMSILKDTLRHRFQQKPEETKAMLELSCLSSHGINGISTALQYGLKQFLCSHSNAKKLASLTSSQTKKPPSPLSSISEEEILVNLYHDTSPRYMLIVQSQDKNVMLKAIDWIFREIESKITELGGSATMKIVQSTSTD